MLNELTPNDTFCDYYQQWVAMYKEGAVRDVTLSKYRLTCAWLQRLIPLLTLAELNRITYQKLLNDYAVSHERQTTMDFHHQLKGAVLDAVDEGLVERDPTRKAIIKGKSPCAKKQKYLNQFELHRLLNDLDLGPEVSWDWLILLIAKTGLRFSEAIALTPDDFEFSRQVVSVNKTWDYKTGTGFVPTKNRSSVRKVQLDWQLVIQFSELTKRASPRCADLCGREGLQLHREQRARTPLQASRACPSSPCTDCAIPMHRCSCSPASPSPASPSASGTPA